MIADAWAWFEARPEGYGDCRYIRRTISTMTAMTSATMAMVRVFTGTP